MMQPRTDTARPTIRPDPAKIIVPRKHGQVLIEPRLSVLAPAVRNVSSNEVGRMFAGRSIRECRADARRHLLDSATAWASMTQAPPPTVDALDRRWILTGHQLEFYHAGVWAKVLVADELAQRTGAVAFDILVDHDVVDHNGFDVPAQSANTWTRKLVEWAPPSSVPADGLYAPDATAFEKWDADLADLPQAQTDSLAFFLAALKPAEDSRTRPYAEWLSAARSRFEQSLDIHVHHVPTSLLCAGPVWRAFVGTWIDNAATWIPTYNRHLALYRTREQIKNPQHPMPDLTTTDHAFELPFWIYKVGQPRQRLFLQQTPAGPIILHDDGEIHPTSLLETSEHSFVIRPRALALTMFLRLFFSDIFIHGIGGALYDQITDGILDELFGMIPAYACVSAAWLLPLGQPLEDSDNLPSLKSRRHHAAHNPQIALDPFTARKPEIAESLRQRVTLIDQIAHSLATRRHDAGARADRANWFRQVHALNAALHEKSPRILANLDLQIIEALHSREQNKVLFWREYFFALHTTDSLQKLIATIRGSN